MRNYWNCSKFADIIRGTPKPEYKTSKEWDEWEEQAKSAHPIRFWIADEGLKKVQDVIMWPVDKFNNIRYYICNRFITKTHCLTSKLKRGDYWEVDTRIIHCVFDELVNFVEVEKAWMQICWGDEDEKSPWYAKGRFRTRTFRSARLGLKYIAWEKNITEDDGFTPTQQAKDAAILEELYNWWVYIRPNREEPEDLSGWTDYYKNHTNILDVDDSDQEKVKNILDKNSEIERFYYDEDTLMLNKLISIRGSLWT